MDLEKKVIIVLTLFLIVFSLAQVVVVFVITGGAATTQGTVFLRITGPPPWCGTAITGDITLVQNVTATGDCLIIGADNLVIDGAGFYVISNGYGRAVVNHGYDNLTLKNIGLNNFSTGIYFNGSENSTIFNSSITSVNKDLSTGIYLDLNSSGSNFTSLNLTIFGTGSNGIFVNNSNNNTFTSVEVDSNSSFELWLTNSSFNNTFTGLLLENGPDISSSYVYAVSIEVNNTPPAALAGKTALPYYLTINNLSISSFINFTLAYTNDDVSSITESTIRMYNYNETLTTWLVVAASSVDTVNNVVSADLSSFGTFAAFGYMIAAPVGAGVVGEGAGGGGGGFMVEEEPVYEPTAYEPNISVPDGEYCGPGMVMVAGLCKSISTDKEDEKGIVEVILTGLGGAIATGKEMLKVANSTILWILVALMIYLIVMTKYFMFRFDRKRIRREEE